MKYVVILLMCVLLVGCGPQYKTEYSYIRPTTPGGQSCAAQCQNNQLMCRQNSKLETQNCESMQKQKQLEYDLCNQKNEGKKAEEKTLCAYPVTEFCGNDFRAEQSCTTQYNQCYTLCGGIVSSETLCVANCD